MAQTALGTSTASDSNCDVAASPEFSSAATVTVRQLDQSASPPLTLKEVPQQVDDVLQIQPCAPPAYASLAILSIGSMLGASVTAFALADWVARGQRTSTPPIIASTIFCLLLLALAVRKAGRLRSIGASNVDVLLCRRKLVRSSVVFAVLFLGTAALVGNGIGSSGAETNNLIADVNKMSQLGERVSNARNTAEQTVPAQVEMYKSIEPDVEQLNSVLLKLKDEWQTYDKKYPSQHETVTKELSGIDTGIRRMTLLHQQIATAKEIGNVDDNADEQFRMWQLTMQPLLNQENQLDASNK